MAGAALALPLLAHRPSAFVSPWPSDCRVSASRPLWYANVFCSWQGPSKATLQMSALGQKRTQPIRFIYVRFLRAEPDATTKSVGHPLPTPKRLTRMPRRTGMHRMTLGGHCFAETRPVQPFGAGSGAEAGSVISSIRLTTALFTGTPSRWAAARFARRPSPERCAPSCV